MTREQFESLENNPLIEILDVGDPVKMYIVSPADPEDPLSVQEYEKAGVQFYHQTWYTVCAQCFGDDIHDIFIVHAYECTAGREVF